MLKTHNTLERRLKYWWWIVTLMVLGSFLALAVFGLRPVKYSARAELTIAIDYTRLLPLSELEINDLMVMIGDRLYAPEVVEAVVEQAKAENLNITSEEFYKISEKTQKSHSWVLEVYHDDPEAAAKLTDFWAEASTQFLTEVVQHAVVADYLRQRSKYLVICMQSVTAKPEHEFCNLDNLAEIQAEIVRLQESLVIEDEASYGMPSTFSFFVAKKAHGAYQEVDSGRGLAVLLGAILGFIAAEISINKGYINFQRK